MNGPKKVTDIGQTFRLRKMPALDGLRGLAIVGVLLYHGGYLTGGWLGVDLFFVLSGYLITSLIIKEWIKGEKHLSLVAFWGRRARRLLPALIILFLGVMVYALLLASPLDLQTIRFNGIATMFYSANWYLIGSHSDYFQNTLLPSPLQHTWSLAIEEQFYLVWPLLLMLALKFRHALKTAFGVAIGLAMASVATMIILHANGASISRLYYGTDTRASSLLFGSALGIWHVLIKKQHSEGKSWIALQVVGALSLCGLATAWVTLSGQSGFAYEGGLALCGLGATAVVALAANPRLGVLGKAMCWPPLRALGIISYGVYLYHWPIFLVLNMELNYKNHIIHGLVLFVAEVAITLILAVASYILVEQPIRQRRMFKGLRGLASVSTAAVAILAMLLVVTVGAQSADVVALPSSVDQTFNGPANSPVVMVVGDSTAFSLGAAMAKFSNRLNVSVANWAIIDCGPIYDLGNVMNYSGQLLSSHPDCTSDWQRGIKKTHSNVVIMMFGFPPINSVFFAGGWQHACDPTYDAALEKRIASGVNMFLKGGSRVAIISTPYQSSNGLVGFDPSYTDSYISCQNTVLKSVGENSGSRVAYLDVNKFLCPVDEVCFNNIDGVTMRADGLHFHSYDGLLVSEWILKNIKSQLYSVKHL